MPQPSRTAAVADIFHYLTRLPLLFMTLVITVSLVVAFAPTEASPSRSNTTPAPTATAPTADQLRAQDFEVLKDRASAQQTLITALTTLTGLYVVILSFAAYFRLQQTRDESKEAIDRNQKGFENTKKFYEDRFGELKDRVSDLEGNAHTRVTALVAEVRTDIPALHGIGRRLEKLLAELDSRLPVDGDWTTANTYDKLSRDDKEQALIDEMVINSLDIFNVTEDIGVRRTVARLYVRLGQFYFARAFSLKNKAADEAKNNLPATIHPEDPWNSLCRGSLYFEKAVHVDYTDAVALRARGVIIMHRAIWKKDADKAPDYDKDILAHSRLYIDQSLRNNPAEPGALFARAWLLVRENPPDHDGAVKDLTVLIELARADKLSSRHRRKFLDICYLNRANYKTRILTRSTPSSEQKTAALESIANDLTEGMNVAKTSGKEVGYAGEIRREIDKGGDLELIYPELKSTIDPLLTT